jgi:hypothetical protein
LTSIYNSFILLGMYFIDPVGTPHDCGLYALFVHPYVEGARNLCLAIPCCGNSEYCPSLLGRVAHLLLGILLLIPILNTIIFVVLRYFMTTKVILSEKTDYIQKPRIEKERAKKIDTFNEQRKALHKQMTSLPKEDSGYDSERNVLNKQICAIEQEVAKEMCHRAYKEVRRHIRYSARKDKTLVQWDGLITGAPSDTSTVQIKREKVSEAEFTQAGALSQQEGYNHLCGYYALFFMLQAVTGKEFTNRDTFHPLMRQWLKLIAIYRTTAVLSNRRNEPIPYGLEISVKGLLPAEMQYLINNSPELAPLRETYGCFVLDLEEYTVNEAVKEPIQLLGKSKSENKNPEAFPLYFILKDMQMHYYFVCAKEPGKFTFAHSLNYSILNPHYFNTQNFTDTLGALTGTHTDLYLTW